MLMKTLYSSPYMVLTDEEYSKHYFIEGERVCSKIGGGFALAAIDPSSTPQNFLHDNPDQVATDLWDMVRRGIDCTGFPPENVETKKELRSAENLNDDSEINQYFYHSDHLGSSSFITDATGNATQHLQYLAFGELWVNQQSGSFDSRYKFSAKELDDETQYGYYGSRYLDSDLSVWLSIDPKSNRLPSFSPYSSFKNNPVMFADPDGQFPVLSSIVGFAKGLFAGRNNFEKPGTSRMGNAFRSAWRHEKNSWKITGGLLVADKDKSFGGKLGQVCSRFTSEIVQTTVGYLYNQFANLFGNVSNVKYYYGATAVIGAGIGRNSASIGCFISLGNDEEAKVGIGEGCYTTMHEYGHYIQSQELGWRYWFDIAWPSVRGKTEQEWDANYNAAMFFQSKDNSFTWNTEYFEKGSWSYNYSRFPDGKSSILKLLPTLRKIDLLFFQPL